MGRKDDSEYKKIKSVSTDKRKNNLNNTGKQWTGERGFSNSFICKELISSIFKEFKTDIPQKEKHKFPLKMCNMDENVMLSDRSLTQKPPIIWFHLYELSRISKSTETG